MRLNLELVVDIISFSFGLFFRSIRTAAIAAPLALLVAAGVADYTVSQELPRLLAQSDTGTSEDLVALARGGRIAYAVAYPGGVIASIRQAYDRSALPVTMPGPSVRPAALRIDTTEIEQARVSADLRDHDAFVLNRQVVPSRAVVELGSLVQMTTHPQVCTVTGFLMGLILTFSVLSGAMGAETPIRPGFITAFDDTLHPPRRERTTS